MNYIPTHLINYSIPIDSLDGFKDNEWFKKLSCKLKLVYQEETYFKIVTNGVKCDDGFLISREDYPLKIYAESESGNARIILFDEKIHGYSSLLIEKKESNCKNKKEFIYTDNLGTSMFEVYVWTNTSIDFIDEFNFNKDNKLLLLTGEYVDINFLRRNAFDAFGIILKSKDEKYSVLTEIELA